MTPTPNDEMATAHRDYYADKERMDDLRRLIDAFVTDPPKRCHRVTVESLKTAAHGLASDSAHVVAVWD